MNTLLGLCLWAAVLAAQEDQITQLSKALAAGILLAQQDKMSDAAEIFERCSKQYPKSFEAKYNLALARISLAQYPNALDTLNSIAPATPDEKASVEYLTGKIFLNTNHLKEAQKSLASAYSQRPKEENYALDLGLLYVRSAAYTQAIDVLQPSSAVHPTSQDLKLELALADVLAGRHQDGIAICHDLQKQDPALSVTDLIAAFSYCAEKDYKACEDEASNGLARSHANPYLYYLRARARWDAGETEHAQMLADVSNAIQKMQACGVCLLLRSRVLEASHEYPSALADLKQAIILDGEAAPAWYQLSVLYRKTGQPEKAAGALQHYRSLHDSGSNQEAESFRKQFLNIVGDH